MRSACIIKKSMKESDIILVSDSNDIFIGVFDESSGLFLEKSRFKVPIKNSFIQKIVMIVTLGNLFYVFLSKFAIFVFDAQFLLIAELAPEKNRFFVDCCLIGDGKLLLWDSEVFCRMIIRTNSVFFIIINFDPL